MNLLGNILTIARFESKILWRNWFFRIFAIGILFFLTIFNTAAYSQAGESRLFMIANSWGIPYANMILLSIPQVAAVIFLATGIIKKDKKIDTNEVFFVREISNTAYVFGKALAVFKLFFWLNVVILTVGLIYNLTNPDTLFNPLAYIIYPLLSSLPTIVFATGVSFLLVTLFRNQPITIILLLGISSFVLIYFQGKYANAFDFMAFRFNMMASDMTGFSGLKVILLQRFFYFLSGVALLFATSFFIDRLPNKRSNQLITGLISIVLIAVSTLVFLDLWSIRTSSISLRNQLVEVNGNWADQPNASIRSHHISLEHQGDQIRSTSTLKVFNNEPTQLSTLYFTLNPGLTVDGVQMDGSDVTFERDQHIVIIKPTKSLKPTGESEITISYGGTVLENVAHLEVEQKRYELIESSFVYAIEKRYAFLQPDYVLFTKDVLWYPDTQIGYSRQSPVKAREAFIDFSLSVKTEESLLPVSQGEYKKDESGIHRFNPSYPLPQLSLAIGTYEKKSITVDSVSYEIYHYPNHDYFTPYFDQIGDTLSNLITDLVDGYVHDQKLEYPFKKLQFVETPVQFNAYNKIYEDNQAFVQPEMVLYPEKGGDIRDLDMGRQFKRMDRQAREQNQVMEDREKQANVFNTTIKRVFTKQIGQNWFFDGRDSDDADYSIFPNLYAYNTGVVSKNWTLLNKSISNYLNKVNLPGQDFSRNINGISFTEECNQLMRKSTLMEVLTEETSFSKIQKSIALKGEYLFTYLDQLLGEEAFRAFLYQWINENQHQVTTYEAFQSAILETFNLDINPVINQVYSATNQPSFVIENKEEYELLDGDRKRYQVAFDVKNISDQIGVIKISLNAGTEYNELGFFRQRNEDASENEVTYSSVLNPGETKKFGFIMDEEPEQITINTLVSQNIPSVVSISTSTFNLREKAVPFEGERLITKEPTVDQYEVVVDNEDPGFSSFSPIKATYLREFLDKRNPSDKKYYGNWRRSYSKWLATTGSNFYGQYIRSAHFTRSGKGEKTTEWTPNLKESGFYDIYVFMMGKNQNEFRRGNDNRKFTYDYIINHGDGQDEISYNITNAERGWNFLGSYYFDANEGSVVLTDKCDLRTVYADAIKWVKQ